jgi:L-lactate utilization protein LutB
MNEREKTYFRKKVSKMIDILRKKQYEPYFFETSDEAKNFILEQIAPRETVGIGGSITLREELGIVEAIRKKGNTVFDHWEAGRDPAKRLDIKRKHRQVDVFLSSLNAITTEGVIVNLDGGGNRVASLCSGPKRVIVAAGVNKIVDSLEHAIHRTREKAAVLSALRIKPKAPCVETGFCSDCSAAERICAALLILMKRPNDIENFKIILINEVLGD